MGFDAYTYPSPDTTLRDVLEFLEALGFKRLGRERIANRGAMFFLHHEGEKQEEAMSGLELQIYPAEDGSDELCIHTRTPIWRSKADHDFHNKTIRFLVQRFRGTFTSDYGAGIYFPSDEDEREGAEAEFYRCYSTFASSLGSV